MARPLRIQFPNAFYHITCRGIERRKTFIDNKDCSQFLKYLFESAETYQVILHAYILMSNHFHLLIQTRKANCSEFMRHFNIRYTGYFNWRYHRSGNLYQGRYQAYLIDADNYLLEVSRYLHLNCVRVKGMEGLSYQERWRYLREYPWSSVHGYLDERKVMEGIEYSLILSMVGGRVGYREFLIDGIKRGFTNPFEKVRHRVILGGDDFVLQVKKYLKHGSAREQPAYREMVIKVLTPEELIKILFKECGITQEMLSQRNENGKIRGMVAELLYRYCEITQAQIGFYLGGIDYMAVYQLRSRLKEQMKINKTVRRWFNEIEKKIKEMIL